MSEKTEKATPYKLKKSKEKGQLNKSTELNTCLSLSIALVFTIENTSSLHSLKILMIQFFHLATHFSFTINTVCQLYQLILSTLLKLWGPFALVSFISFILVTCLQTGFNNTTHLLLPNFSRLSPSQNIKRLFSEKLFFSLTKNSIKIGLFFLMITINLYHELEKLMPFMQLNPASYPLLFKHLISKLSLELLACFFFIAILDKWYTHWKYSKDHRMTKQELREEYRQREGDPQIKQKIKQLQQRLRQKISSLKQIKTADVIITNPTHLAIALKYQRHVMPAPLVVCKAKGEMAKSVIALAKRHKIPIINNKPFAQTLFASVGLNQWINQEHYPIAAAIFGEVYRQQAFSTL